MRPFRLTLCLGLALAATPVHGEAPPRELRFTIAYLTSPDPMARGWMIDRRSAFARKPTLAEFERAAPGLGKEDFGLSFDCAVSADGTLSGCDQIVDVSHHADGPRYVSALLPLVRIDRSSAAFALSKGYRITLGVALARFRDPPAPAVPCVGQNCYRDASPPPPPPPEAENPVLAFAIDQAQHCYDDAWGLAANAFVVARDVLHDDTVPITSDRYRSLVLDAVKRRQAVGRCIADFKQASQSIPGTATDGKAVDVRLQEFLIGYQDLTSKQFEILAGSLDRRTGELEETFPF